MASLKEIKGRINSVKSTGKITSAMKMIASSKLHKAQLAIKNMLPYERLLMQIMGNFLSSETGVQSPYITERPVKRVALVIFSSNSSLCGGFNASIIKELQHFLAGYASLGKGAIDIYPVGKKVAKAVEKAGLKPKGDYSSMAEYPSFKSASTLASQVMKSFTDGEVDKVEMIYFHFKSTASQRLTRKVYLPIQLEEFKVQPADSSKMGKKTEGWEKDYIVEPSCVEVLTSLLPQALHLEVFTALLDSNASEHAARTMAMQTATDNANDLLQDLTLMYNKSRQQAITNELLDIVAGSMK